MSNVKQQGEEWKGEMIACGFFIFFQKQVYFMKGTVNKIGREKGAFYGLIDYVFHITLTMYSQLYIKSEACRSLTKNSLTQQQFKLGGLGLENRVATWVLNLDIFSAD